MLSFLVARDTMHQQQWLAAIEDIGGREALAFARASIAPRQRRNRRIWSWEANATECQRN
jgi:Mn-containing catalase